MSSSWGNDITVKAIQGLIIFLIVVSIYISIRFEWRMAVGGIVALLHDLVLAAGVYSLVGFEVTPSTVVGLLTILGFSLYDTVVVYDKVDENAKDILAGSRMTYSEAANLAVNQTLMRSINTSLIALLPVAGLLFVGAGLLGVGTIKDLALILFVGLASGAYSSLFLATPIVVRPHRARARGTRRWPSGWRPSGPATAKQPATRSLAERRPAPPAAAAPAGRRPAPAPQAGRPAAATAAGDRVQRRRRRRIALGRRSRRRLRDVPDFPKPGIVFKDITPLLADGAAFARGRSTRWPTLAGRPATVDLVAGVEARGFMLAAALAARTGLRPGAGAQGRQAAAADRRRSPTSSSTAGRDRGAGARARRAAGAARRRRAGHRRHAARRRRPGRARPAAQSPASACCSSSGFLDGRSSRCRRLHRRCCTPDGADRRTRLGGVRLAGDGAPLDSAEHRRASADRSATDAPPVAPHRRRPAPSQRHRRRRGPRARSPPTAGARRRPSPPPAPRTGRPHRRRVRDRLARRLVTDRRGRPAVKPVLEPLLAIHRGAHPKADARLLQRGYDVAEECHRGQLRKSGDPYITHPLAVATILAELGMDTTTLVAALLHDTVEDTGMTPDGHRRPSSAPRSRTSSTA